MRVSSVFLLVFTLFFMAAFIAMNTFAQFVAEGLVSYWPFDENTILGETVQDVEGGNDGTISGDPEIVPGKASEALEFDGVGDYINIPAAAINDLAGGTIEAWIKLDSNEEITITGKEHGGVVTSAVFSIGYYCNSNGFPAPGEAGKLYFHAKNPGGPQAASSSSTLDNGQWYHIAVTFDTGSASFYIDGSLDSTTDGDYSVPDDPDPDDTTIGVWWNTGFFSGIIDEIRVYERVLSEAEVEQNFFRGAAVVFNNKLALTWGGIKASE